MTYQLESPKPNEFRILIVDDFAKNLQILGSLLRSEGYNVEFAINGSDAIKWTQKSSFDLILLDLMMPEMSGYEVCKNLKSDLSTKDIPIIYLTAKTDLESIVEGFKSGAVDYITKPFESTELLVRVNTHLKVQWQRKELIRINAEKDKLFSIVAHDIKNPFTSILTGIELLEQSFDNLNREKLKSRIFKLFSQIQKVIAISTNLLNWSRSSANLLKTEFKNVELQSLIEDAISFYSISCSNKNIVIKTDIAEGLSVFVDREQIDVVLRNVLSNALKFSYEASIVFVKAQSANEHVKIEIKDTGIGMSQDQLNKLFSTSALKNTLGTNNEKGTGLGLLIIERFLRSNNGKVRVESEPGIGTTVTILLPGINQ